MSRATVECSPLSWTQYRDWFALHSHEISGCAPFYHPAWLHAVTEALGFELGLIRIEDAGELAAIVPGFLTRRGPFRLFGSPLRGTMTPYLGPIGCMDIWRPEVRQELVEQASEFARRHWRRIGPDRAH